MSRQGSAALQKLRVEQKPYWDIERARIVPARNLNAYDLLKHKNVLLTKDSVEHLQEALK